MHTNHVTLNEYLTNEELYSYSVLVNRPQRQISVA